MKVSKCFLENPESKYMDVADRLGIEPQTVGAIIFESRRKGLLPMSHKSKWTAETIAECLKSRGVDEE